jgi:hypothetical protein
MTGLTRNAFWQLKNALFSEEERRNSALGKRKRGRPPLLSPDSQLGLYLFYIGSTMGIKWLCLLFGITPSTCSHFINAMISRVCTHLAAHPLAEVRFPNDEKMKRFAEQIQLREPSIDDVIGFMDGLSLATEYTSERMAQNAMYCGYDCVIRW